MMTEAEEKQITDYLIFQKLPLDILLEVKDHMISQVLDIQINENLNFETAFLRAKRLWENDFKMTSYSVFYSEQIPVIVKRIVKTRYNSILKKSFLLALIFFVINLVLIYYSNSEESYTLLFRLQNGLFFLAPIFVWAYHYKIRKFIRTDFKYKGVLFYTMYQHNMKLMFICAMSMIQVVNKNGYYAYQFFREHHTAEIFGAVITLVIPFILQTAVIFTLLNFFEHKKALKRVRGFLQSSGG